MSDIIVTVGEEGTPPVVIITPGETVLPTAGVQVQTQEETPVVHIHIDENSAQSAADSAAAAQAALDALSGISITGCIEKAEFAEATMTGDSYLQFSIPQFSSIRFIDDSTIFRGVYLFSGYKAYSGKKLTLKNFQTTDIILTHLDNDPLLNTPLYFSSETDYILKPGKIIEFSLSMITNRFEAIGSESNQPDDYSKVVYFNSVNPATATIFDLNNPPTINDDSLKVDDDNLYVGTDATTWVYKTSTAIYETKAISANSSNFNLAGTNTDSGNNKTANIKRTGRVGGGNAIDADDFVTKAQHDTKGDMTTNTNQTVSGVKTFLAGKFGLRNTANTFTSFFASVVTASRTWTWPDKNGTVAMTSDIPSTGYISGGVINYLSKYLTYTTVGISRLFDNGTYFGIGTVNTPNKDISLGCQSNREIGIEDSDSMTNGRELIVAAGRTVSYGLNIEFLPIGQGVDIWRGFSGHVNGNVYAAIASGSTGGVYTQTLGTGNFVKTTVLVLPQVNSIICLPNGNIYIGATNGNIYRQINATGSFTLVQNIGGAIIKLSADVNNNVYAISGGTIYKRTNDAGTFSAMTITSRVYSSVASHPNGNNYACVSNGDIYMQTAGAGDFNALSQTVRTWTDLAILPNGNVYCFAASVMYIQTAGTGGFISSGLTSRLWQCIGAAVTSNSMYAFVFASDVYKQLLSGTGTPNLNGGSLKLKAGIGKGTGQSRVLITTGQKTVSGIDMQIEAVRAEYDENGNYKRIGTPVYADNAAALSGGLTAGMEYRTATGIKMEVY